MNDIESKREKLLQKMSKKWDLSELTGCHVWRTPLPGEYGRMRVGGGGRMYAHRLSYLLNKGDIPSDMNVLHQCDNPQCVNPEHLFLGTQRENVEDCMRKGRKPPTVRKLTAHSADSIRRCWNNGIKQTELAALWNVSVQHVNNIINGRKWAS